MLRQPEELRARTKDFAKRVVSIFRALPKSDEARVLAKQVLRSGTAAGANYRAVCRVRPKAEFISKIRVVVEEADETVFWLELLVETGVVKESRIENLLTEAEELTAIFAASPANSEGQLNGPMTQ